MTRVSLLALLLSAPVALGDDWPQWRGPDRTGLSKETGLLKDWPKEGPKLLWKATGLGDGYGTPSVVGDRVYAIGSEGEDEALFCLDGTKEGAKVWTVKMGKYKKVDHPGPPRRRPSTATSPTSLAARASLLRRCQDGRDEVDEGSQEGLRRPVGPAGATPNRR